MVLYITNIGNIWQEGDIECLIFILYFLFIKCVRRVWVCASCVGVCGCVVYLCVLFIFLYCVPKSVIKNNSLCVRVSVCRVRLFLYQP